MLPLDILRLISLDSPGSILQWYKPVKALRFPTLVHCLLRNTIMMNAVTTTLLMTGYTHRQSQLLQNTITALANGITSEGFIGTAINPHLCLIVFRSGINMDYATGNMGPLLYVPMVIYNGTIMENSIIPMGLPSNAQKIPASISTENSTANTMNPRL